jgi:hypothetical protein
MGWVWNDDPTFSPKIWNDSFKENNAVRMAYIYLNRLSKLESRIFLFGGIKMAN